MKKQEIEQVIPHRDPYLMLDSVDVEINGEKGKGYKKLTGNEFFFEGHFPDRPVMPGVLIVEAIAQTSMVVAGRGDLKIKAVRQVKFRQTIESDDYMDMYYNAENFNLKPVFIKASKVFVDRILRN